MASWRNLIGWMSQERKGTWRQRDSTIQARGGVGPGAASLGRGGAADAAPLRC